jgi:Flp pilus assembly secretin CpaC
MFVLILMPALLPMASQAELSEDLTLMPDASEKIEVPFGVREIYISNESIIDAKPGPDGDSVIVTGIKQGKSELRISRVGREDVVYKIEVEPALKDLANEVEELIGNIEGMEVTIVGEQIVLKGELLTRADMRRVTSVEKAFEGKVKNLTTLDTAGHDAAVKKALEKEIKLKSVEVEVDGDKVVLTGTVPTRADLARVKKLIKKKRLENVTMMLQVQP